MLSIPFYQKVLLLICFFCVAAAVDKVVAKENANRWKEYLFMLTLGSIVSLIGLLYDQLIVTISPEYFAIAKGLGYGNLRFETAMMGMRAGFVAGIVMSGAFLLVNKAQEIFHLLKWLKFIIPFTFAMLFIGPIVGWVFYSTGVNPYTLCDDKNFYLLLVWCTQGMLYLGTITATAIACYRIRLEDLRT